LNVLLALNCNLMKKKTHCTLTSHPGKAMYNKSCTL
jgi:hypothetical protein